MTGRMGLSAVTRGTIDRALMVAVYGMEGVGKTSLGASAPRPIFLGTERGTEHLDVARFPIPQTWEDCHDAVTVLEKEKHEHETLVFDSLDWAETLCWESVCRDWGVEDIESAGPNGGGFGKGYGCALTKWKKLLDRFEQLRDRRTMNVILIAHSTVRPFKNPAGADYMRYSMKIQEKAAALVKESVGAVLFLMFDEQVGFVKVADGKDAGPKGRIMAGAVKRRVIRTEYGAAWDAKCRPSIPDPMLFRQDTGWGDFALARKKAMDPALLEGRARELAAAIAKGQPEEKRAAVQKAIDGAKGNAARMEALVGRLLEIRQQQDEPPQG